MLHVIGDYNLPLQVCEWKSFAEDQLMTVPDNGYA